jgi:hypothetical protein
VAARAGSSAAGGSAAGGSAAGGSAAGGSAVGASPHGRAHHHHHRRRRRHRRHRDAAAAGDEEEQEEEMGVADEEGGVLCARCASGRSDAGNELLLCDRPGCGGGWHLRCLQPPLDGVPEGVWYCPACAADADWEPEMDFDDE